MEKDNPNHAMEQFIKGLGGFWRVFWKNAADQGMLVSTLIAMNLGLIYAIYNRNEELRKQRFEFKADIAEVRNEYKTEITRLRYEIDSVRQGLDDCTTDRIRLATENATLHQILRTTTTTRK